MEKLLTAVNAFSELLQIKIEVWSDFQLIAHTAEEPDTGSTKAAVQETEPKGESGSPWRADSYPLFLAAWEKHHPLIISEPGRHAFCAQCPEKKDCRLHLHLFFPCEDDGPAGGTGVSLKVPQDPALLKRGPSAHALLETAPNVADYIHLLLRENRQLRQETLLRQELYYLMDTRPEAILLLDENKNIVHCNAQALKQGLDSTFSLPEAAKLWQHELERTTNPSFTLPKAAGHVLLEGKSFYFNRSLLGTLIHTRFPSPLPAPAKPKISEDPWPDFLGKDPHLLHVMDIAEQASKSDSTILLRGESGTGKESFALAIHRQSPRQNGPFIAVNCAAIPADLLESELFGYEEGSFTGAKKGGKPGKIQLADRGTLFLDEIGDMPMPLQVKLLRVLQERKIEKVGGTSPLPVDIRVIAATNRNLEKLIEQGRFREDLFFRLSVIPIHIPPLRERKEDVEILLNYYLRKYCVLLHKDFKIFSHEALMYLKEYTWPGNVRELENLVEYLVNIHAQDVITPEQLSLSIRDGVLASTAQATDAKFAGMDQKSATAPAVHKKGAVHFKAMSEEQRRQEIIRMLNQYGWDTDGKKKAAENLQISIATLYRQIKRYRIN